MKPALFYAIKRYRPGTIIAVTSEKRNRWFGRDTRDNDPTHGTFEDLRGRFDTLDQAKAAQSDIREIVERYKVQRDELSRQMSALYASEHAEIDEVVKRHASTATV
jgi:hypothetical protein